MMNHQEEATKLLEFIAGKSSDKDLQSNEVSAFGILSIAHSLVALNERLDSLTETFKVSGKTYGSLMIVNRNED